MDAMFPNLWFSARPSNVPLLPVEKLRFRLMPFVNLLTPTQLVAFAVVFEILKDKVTNRDADHDFEVSLPAAPCADVTSWPTSPSNAWPQSSFATSPTSVGDALSAASVVAGTSTRTVLLSVSSVGSRTSAPTLQPLRAREPEACSTLCPISKSSLRGLLLSAHVHTDYELDIRHPGGQIATTGACTAPFAAPNELVPQ